MVSPLSDLGSGYRKVVTHGNAGYKNFQVLQRLPEGRYYWSVQAVDNGYSGSAFATEESFAICYPTALQGDTTICYEEVLELAAGETTDVVNWYSKTDGLLAGNTNNFSHTITGNDTIIVEVTKPYSCTTYDTLTVQVSIPDAVDLGADREICFGSEVSLAVALSYDSVNWHNPEGLLSADTYEYGYEVEGSETIIAEAFNAYGCVAYDTVAVEMLSLPPVNLGSDTAICYQQTLLFELPDTGATINWRSALQGSLATDTNRYEWQVLQKDTIIAEVTDGNSCFNTDSVVVDMLPLPQIDIGADTAICFNEDILLELSDTWETVNWLTTDHQTLAADTNRFLFSVLEKDTIIAEVFDGNRCVNYDSVIIDVLPLPDFEIGSDTAICYNETILLETGSGYDEVNWYSKVKNTALLMDSWFINYQVEETDTLIAEVFNNNRCVSYDTIVVEMIPLPDYTLGADLNICTGDSVTLEIPGTWDAVNWYTTGDLILEQNSAVYKFLPENDITIWSEVFNGGGCVAYDTISISMLDLPQFDLGPDRTYCAGDSVIFEVESHASTHVWTNQEGQQLADTKDYQYLAEASDQLFLTATDNDRCVYTDSVSVQVHALPEFEVEGAGEICARDTLRLAVNNDGWASLNWLNADGDTLANDTGTLTLPLEQTTELLVEFKDKHACVTINSHEVVVQPRPVARAGQDTLLCFGESAVLGEPDEDTTGLTFAWSPGTGLDDAAVAQPVASPVSPTTYGLLVTNAAGCDATDSVYVEVNPEILVEAGPDTGICIGDSVTLGGAPTASGSRFGYSYQWLTAAGSVPGDLSNPVVAPKETTTYFVLVASGKCAVEYDSIEVVVNPLPQVEVVDDQSIGAGQSVQLYASGGVGYAWSPQESLDDALAAMPNASPLKTTTYQVAVTDENGCTEEGSTQVIVQNSLFIPNLFTPNGDGNNDMFKLYGSGVKTIEFSVFDQNGNRLFHSTSVDEAFGHGWDGTAGGEKVKNDIYLWKINGEYYNGEKVRYEGKNSGIIKLVK